jgi:hypothetical protein
MEESKNFKMLETESNPKQFFFKKTLVITDDTLLAFALGTCHY